MYMFVDKDIRVLDVVAVTTTNNEVKLHGHATNGRMTFRWRAVADPKGWIVMVEDGTMRRTVWQGPTFNLGLEVAAAVRKHVY